MPKLLRTMPIGAWILLVVFGFCTAYSLFHLVVGIMDRNLHFIVGGVAFTALSIPLIIMCLNARRDDDRNPGDPDRGQ